MRTDNDLLRVAKENEHRLFLWMQRKFQHSLQVPVTGHLQATEGQIRALWEERFGAPLPRNLDIQKAFQAVYLDAGEEWIRSELR